MQAAEIAKKLNSAIWERNFPKSQFNARLTKNKMAEAMMNIPAG